VRGPATQGGLYGYRPSQGFYDLEDVVVCVLSLDTPGFFTRSPELFTKLFSVWSKDTELEMDMDSFTMPTKMLHRTDIVELADQDAQKMLDDFFKQVEDHFNMTSETIDLDELWMENAVNQSYLDYFDTVYLDLNSLESWDLNGEPLTRAFGEMTDGAAPPVDPSVNLTWTNGQNETIRSRYDEAIKRGRQWRDFYSEHVNPTNPDTCSESIIAYTYYTDVPANRQDLVPFDFTGGDVTGGFWNTLPQSYGGAPEIIVPFGQVQYFSNFTRRAEYRPITASFSAARGCDAVLFKMVDGLAEAGILGEVQTGRLAYPL
jgi:Asp-tRNA(Asn)/Glu-tRNA(Gln) amidotransferase A subunit family amidase